ncbi:Nopaline-binding periplasmic protein [Ensifer psoraleae]|uniref:transporter substrate-binding domain-containing protein n=1 Tax=Sinorhizobium psoraleae TaxID=520838 RepID=UPI0015687C75|nr:transporter substrate-binding domain-containing protein [Sinorhizobium psoraleae]NRP72152.1 Nopaline-binding periplasmic protein [Sinorhizobium psoraleae]
MNMTFSLIKKVALIAAMAVVTSTAYAQEQSTWDQIQSTKKVRLGCAQSEPWCFKDVTGSDEPGGIETNGNVYRGVAVALGKDVADALGVELEIVETTWGNAVAGLQANQYDFMFQLDATPQRALSIDFAGPVMWYPVALLVKNDFAPTTWAELSDPKYKLAAPSGTTFVDVIKKNAPEATLATFQQSNEAIAAFQSGRVDGAASTGPMADVSRLRLKTGKTLVPTPVVARPSSAGLRKETDSRWRDFLQVAVSYSYDTGRTQQLYEDFLAFRGLDPKTAASTRKEDLLR